jgi:hypothetical protein
MITILLRLERFRVRYADAEEARDLRDPDRLRAGGFGAALTIRHGDTGMDKFVALEK